MPQELLGECKFCNLADALVHLATGDEVRSSPTVVYTQGFIPVGVDVSAKGCQEDFFRGVGLEVPIGITLSGRVVSMEW